MSDRLDGFDTSAVLEPLKDFQRRTVDYVFQRLFKNDGGSGRFLVADEVGLGKTLVARGVIAKAIQHLRHTVERIDVVYICNNQDIVRQNLNRLNFFDDGNETGLCTRITLMPTEVQDLNRRRVNMLGLSPGTSFDLRSSTGRKKERALIWRMLQTQWKLETLPGAHEMFRVGAGPDGWRYALRRAMDEDIDEKLESRFIQTVAGEQDLEDECRKLCRQFCRYGKPSSEIRQRRSNLISHLRTLLAEVCVDALEPDLIILDEFQRYRKIIDGTDEQTYLAHRLLNWEDVSLLLLSATPYKMYTASAEEEDHYEDFVRVSEFLLDDAEAVRRLKQSLDDYRRGLYAAPHKGTGPLRQARHRAESILRRVMVRNERRRASGGDMVEENGGGGSTIGPGELNDYALFNEIGEIVDGPTPVEYWKSAPYLLNVMSRDGYKVKRNLNKKLDRGEPVRPDRQTGAALLRQEDIDRYNVLDPRNGRLRSIIEHTLDAESWRLLWVPASLPYYRTDSIYDSPDLADFTKRLVFSSWRMVPRAIATLCSYEAERRMMAEAEGVEYSNATSDIARLLEFAREGERPTGMPVLGLIYPCQTLATEIDPLDECGNGDELPDIDDLQRWVQEQVKALLQPIVEREASERAPGHRDDEAWYWAGAVRLDALHHREALKQWLTTDDDELQWARMLEGRDDDDRGPEGFRMHIEQLRRCADGELQLGPPPDDLYEVIAQMAIGGPGVVALRALLRQVPDGLQVAPQHTLAGAARTALGFRTLFNLHDVRAMLRPPGRREETPYWRIALEHCVDGNLQAVMDEYLHVLRESLGLIDADPGRVAAEITEEIEGVLSLIGAPLALDEFSRDGGALRRRGNIRVRCRYALRFGDVRSEEGRVARRADVRRAFNSPFRPFILATTSIGQEGLDFHLYCHSVCHWNLPSNPVDLEQREGRINRYKCHAIRRSVARNLGLSAVTQGTESDPWHELFAAAADRRRPHETELVPWWVYGRANTVKIERLVPMLPMSREQQHLPALKRALAAYRMVFGQPRQEDLLEYILSLTDTELDMEKLQECQIDLTPP